MAERRLLKEYGQLGKKPVGNENRQILGLMPLSEDNMFEWEAWIAKPTKEDSDYYYNGKWKLDIRVGARYPVEPPQVRFSRDTPVFHPNVNMETGEICLDILKSENWSPAWNLQYLVVAILLLLGYPEPDSPLNVDSANLFRHDKVGFESMVQYYIWKFNTFYEPLVNPADRRGLKPEASSSVLGANSLDETTLTKDEGDKDVRISVRINMDDVHLDQLSSDKSGSTINDKTERYVTGGSVSPLSGRKSPNVKVIQDVGEEVRKQFIQKVNEISHSSSSSQGSCSSDSDNLDGVKQQVADNVSKQVEKLCSKANSPEGAALEEETHDIDSKTYQQDDSMEKMKQDFMKQVDDRIRKHEEEVKRSSGGPQSSASEPQGSLKTQPSTQEARISSKEEPQSKNVHNGEKTIPEIIRPQPRAQKSSASVGSSIGSNRNVSHGSASDNANDGDSASEKSMKSMRSSMLRIKRSFSRKDKNKNRRSKQEGSTLEDPNHSRGKPFSKILEKR
ncbi:Piso0_004811 [Millerozyma farinosa CBS 7064]|uniref:Piso0_004811 protein n=1 Tax=Pichia sorbitophila (strain ATCC MYA-4447 / BCRC 22081 / CBS 7064 / NBRC 10061 / NRRL Y-12695) TaxID=559304 RepID=G8Y3G1_PICSO|nr:Piso0_004811 [Millerozyma farinosa CBS 7064]